MELLTLQVARRNRPVAGGLLVLTSALLFAGVGALVKAISANFGSERRVLILVYPQFRKFKTWFGFLSTVRCLHAKASRGKIGATSSGAQNESAVFIPPVY